MSEAERKIYSEFFCGVLDFCGVGFYGVWLLWGVVSVGLAGGARLVPWCFPLGSCLVAIDSLLSALIRSGEGKSFGDAGFGFRLPLSASCTIGVFVSAWALSEAAKKTLLALWILAPVPCSWLLQLRVVARGLGVFLSAFVRSREETYIMFQCGS